jgi:hypothetical protein
MMSRRRILGLDGAMGEPGRQGTAVASVRIQRWRGVAALSLASGELQATFVPEMNLLGASLRHGGDEFLALPGGVGAYRRSAPRACRCSRRGRTG